MKKRVLSILLVIAIAVSLCTSLAGVAYADGDTVSHTLKNNETVWSICKDLGLTYSKCIAAIRQLNGITNDSQFNNLKVGRVLVFPKTDADAAKIIGSSSGSGSGSSTITIPAGTTVKYTVKSGDTIGNICKTMKIDYDVYKEVIMKLNGFTSTVQLSKIYVKQVLTFPKDEASAKTLADLFAANPGSSVTPGGGSAVPGTAALYFVPHTMASGESIFSVCSAYGMDYSKYSGAISALNNISNLSKVAVGKVVYVPSSTAPSSGSYYKVVKHTISSGQSTFSICTAYGLDYSKVSAVLECLNPKYKLSSIPVGGTLLVPVLTTAAAEGNSGGSGGGSGSSPTPTPAPITPKKEGEEVRVYFQGDPASISLSKDSTPLKNGDIIKVGDKLKVTATDKTPNYKTVLTVTWGGGAVTVDKDGNFTVPGGDVTVTLKYEPNAKLALIYYPEADLSLTNSKGAAVATKSDVNAGDTIKVVATILKVGYLPKVTVTAENGSVKTNVTVSAVKDKDNEFTFVVPTGYTKITVTVSYEAKTT